MTMKAGELVFIDTNILLSATDTSRSAYEPARNLFRQLLAAGMSPAVSGQVLREYLVVATRPAKENGFGMTPEDAVHNIRQFQKKVVVFDERRSTAELLQRLVLKYRLMGKRIHDANIAAVMKTHGIKYLVTDNLSDFSCFDEISVLSCSQASEEFQ